MSCEFISEMRENSHSPILEISRQWESGFDNSAVSILWWRCLGEPGKGEEGAGSPRCAPGHRDLASWITSRMCCGVSSILHARYRAVATARYGFVRRTSTLL